VEVYVEQTGAGGKFIHTGYTHYMVMPQHRAKKGDYTQ